MTQVNISGVLIHARPERVELVRATLEEFPGVEIHAVSEDGRLVVTVEDDVAGYTADTVARFHDVEGVLSASLVYHHCEDEQDLQESAQ
jgi:nitrate reductase NapD